MERPQPSIAHQVIEFYKTIVSAKYGAMAGWPLLSGFNWKIASYRSTPIIVLQHSGHVGMVQHTNLGELSLAQVGVEQISDTNFEAVIERIEKLLKLDERDIVLIQEGGILHGGKNSTQCRESPCPAPSSLPKARANPRLTTHEDFSQSQRYGQAESEGV